MRIRSLPLRLQPIEGEAIDSYIEAYAARIGATFTEFEDAVGLERIPNSERRGWLVQLGGNELTSLAAATGLPADCLAADDVVPLRRTSRSSGFVPAVPYLRRPMGICAGITILSGVPRGHRGAMVSYVATRLVVRVLETLMCTRASVSGMW